MVSPGAISSIRIKKPNVAPTVKKNSIAHMYIRPMRLWSVVNNHDFQPEALSR
jgi:hypothetical protein